MLQSFPRGCGMDLDLDEENLKARVAYALEIGAQINRFQSDFPELQGPQARMPAFTWEQLGRQLHHLVQRPELRAILPDRLSALRRMAAWKPAEMVLQEILLEAWLLLDDEPALASEGEGEMT